MHLEQEHAHAIQGVRLLSEHLRESVPLTALATACVHGRLTGVSNGGQVDAAAAFFMGLGLAAHSILRAEMPRPR